MWKCKHCNQQFDYSRTTEKANHSRHCDLNPNKKASYAAIKKALDDRSDELLGEINVYQVECHECKKPFLVEEREKQHPVKDQYFCSRSCANSIGGRAKAEKHHTDDIAHYRTVAWRYHEKKCIVCNEENVVAVHHLNNNHDDNDPKNLVPLCPTHHQYVHSKFKYLVEDKIDRYIKDKWGT